MSFFKKLKDRLFRSSDKIGEGLEALVSDGADEGAVADAAAPAVPAIDATAKPAPSAAPAPEALPQPGRLSSNPNPPQQGRAFWAGSLAAAVPRRRAGCWTMRCWKALRNS